MIEPREVLREFAKGLNVVSHSQQKQHPLLSDFLKTFLTGSQRLLSNQRLQMKWLIQLEYNMGKLAEMDHAFRLDALIPYLIQSWKLIQMRLRFGQIFLAHPRKALILWLIRLKL